MIGRNKRGIRRASMRVRLAVAAAVLVGGGAAGVVAMSASNNSAVSAQSAGYYTHHEHKLSESHAMSEAMHWWDRSQQTSLSLISQMVTVSSVATTSWHGHTLVTQRGVVAAAGQNQFVLRSADGQFEVWNFNRGAKFLNVGGSRTGWNAMTGGTMSSYGDWNWSNSSNSHWNMRTTTLARNDLVFVFGERVNGRLWAQLVLFAAPFQSTFTGTPTTGTPTTGTPTTGTTQNTFGQNTAVTPTTSNTTPSFSGSHS